MTRGQDVGVYKLYYIPKNNMFVNGDGTIVLDIFKYLTPNELLVFISTRNDIYKRIDNNNIAILYPIYRWWDHERRGECLYAIV